MPGLTVWLNATGRPDDAARIVAAHARMLHTPAYAALTHIRSRGFHVAQVGYPEYPVWASELEGVTVVFEGRCYNHTDAALRRELTDLARRLRAGEDPGARVDELMRKLDGEYLVLLARPDCGELLVFSDPLGLLPVYYYTDDHMLLLAREAKFVQRLKPDPAFDRLGWAQSLCHQYPLGERTLFRDVRHAPAGLFLRARIAGGRVHTQVGSRFTLNLDDKLSEEPGALAYVDDLLELLRAACDDRIQALGNAPLVMSLSGGFDSRVVLAAMQQAGARFAGAVTHKDARWGGGDDARVAEQVAGVFGIEWHLFESGRRTQADMDRMVRLKDGANCVTMTFMLSFLEGIIGRWGRGAALITGNGDHMVCRDNRPGVAIPSLDQLVETMLGRTRTPAEVCERLMGLAPGTLEAALRSRLSDFPERVPERFGAHYGIYERLRKWEVEMQDRLRCFVWQTSPYYSFPLYTYASRIPDSFKQHNELYREVLARLSPRLAHVPLATFCAAPASRLYPLACRANAFVMHLPRRAKGVLRRISKGGRRPHDVPPAEREYLRRALTDKAGLGAMISAASISQFLKTATWVQYDYLWTLVTLDKVSRADGMAS